MKIASAVRTEGAKLVGVARYTSRFEIFFHFLVSQPKASNVARYRRKSQLTSLLQINIFAAVVLYKAFLFFFSETRLTTDIAFSNKKLVCYTITRGSLKLAKSQR